MSRLVLAIVVGGVAIVGLSQSLFAAVVAGVTLAFVVFDISARRPAPPTQIDRDPTPTPNRLVIDLHRRD
ncbi:MAG TPA: hypothetical protein VFQ53_06190 [Kofleriaceae bacterium]|nr:hypothetical protein [Kofleriaceae bacterium]